MGGVAVSPRAATRPPSTDRARAPSAGLPIAIWIVLIVVAHVVIERLPGAGVKLRAAPLAGVFETRIGPSVLLAVAVAVAIGVFGPRLSRELEWRVLVLGSVLVGAAWAVALALIDGWTGLTSALDSRHDYLADVDKIGSPVGFLSSFVDNLGGFSVHVQGHPPGLLLSLAGLDRVGLGGSAFAAVMFIAAGASAGAAVLVGVRDVAGERVARRAAPFLVLAPAAIWIATSADALYAGVGAWAVALVVLATGRRGRRGDAYAVAGGVLIGAVAFLSYGLVLLAAIPCAVAWQRRHARALVLAAIGTAAVFLAFAAAGFSWFAGLLATREHYYAGIASRRPYAEFLVVNAAALGIALGPAVAVALARLRDRRLGLLVVPTFLAIGVAMLSGLSKGEVERIWLPFSVWLLPACAVLAVGPDTNTRRWLGLQGAAALAVAIVVRTPW